MTEEYTISLNESEDIVCEAMPAWGGLWTEEKLDAFAKYVKAYLTILNKYRDRFNWELIYFDGFAGSGSRGEHADIEVKHPSLFDD